MVCLIGSEYSMNGAPMSPINRVMKRDSRRAWLSGLAITLTTIVSYLAFWRLSPGATFVIGGTALVALIIFLWRAGPDGNGS